MHVRSLASSNIRSSDELKYNRRCHHITKDSTYSKMPWWGKSKDPKASEPEASPPASVPDKKGAFDPEKLPDRHKLPAKLQKMLDDSDKDGNVFDDIVDG